MTCVRRRAVSLYRDDSEISNANAPAASRAGEEGDSDDEAWSTVIRDTALQRARMVAAINASSAPDLGRGELADAIREQAFAAMAGLEQVRGVTVQFVRCAQRGPRVRLRAWLDAGSIVTVERDQEEESSTPVLLAAALVVAVERETSPLETMRARRL